MKVPALGSEYLPPREGPITITIQALKENKRPIGFAPWPEDPKPKRKPRTPKA